jgi:hypothetical protein
MAAHPVLRAISLLLEQALCPFPLTVTNPPSPHIRPCLSKAQVVLVSATLPHEVLEMTHKFMTDPVRILVKRDELTLEVRRLHWKLVEPGCTGVVSEGQ